MGFFRFRRTFKIVPGVRLNLSKSGASVSFGPKGLHYTVGPKGIRITPELSTQFQEVATRIAKREGTARVHLDDVYWRGGQ